MKLDELDPHLALGLSESAAIEPTNWEIWCEAAERIAGHSLDGDMFTGADAYSIDAAYEAWEAGATPRGYVDSFRSAAVE